ncbi:hypothetical protein [Salinicoccus sp. ID82-1]|nr:hypothetical protein [Salinicoccus sp. ID82-1]
MEFPEMMKTCILTGIIFLGACSDAQDAAVEKSRSEAFGAK